MEIRFLIILLYVLLMIVIGLLASRKIRSSGDYLVAGNRGTIWQITGSLLATIIGSTAILGTSDLAFSRGWAASWLLLSGAAGLLALVFVAPRVKRFGKYTLPQLVGDFYGKEARMVASVVIPLAWTGVIAAQIIGGARVVNSFFGLSYTWAAWSIGLLFIFYTVIGGQISVIRTDVVQSIIIITGVAAVAIFLFLSEPSAPAGAPPFDFPFNNGFRPADLLVLLLTYSTTFLVGPDIYTRLFCAGNERIARTSVLLTALLLIPFAFMITYLGVFAAHRFPDFDFRQGSSLITVMIHLLPGWGIGLLVAAVLSAVMSSASTTLLTSSVIITQVIQKELDSAHSIRSTQLVVILMGLFSIVLSLWITSIVQSLLMALTFFSGAFIIPVLAGLFGFRTSRSRSVLAMVTGGLVALGGRIAELTGYSGPGNWLIFSAFILNACLLFSGGFRGEKVLEQAGPHGDL